MFDMDPIDISADWFGRDGIALQIEGNDIVHVSNIDEDGTALVTVFTSTHPKASILWTGTVNVFDHRNQTSEED